MRMFSITWGSMSNRVLYEEVERLQRRITEMDLAHARATRDLVSHFLVSLGQDEVVLRDGLTSGLSDLNDHVARLEEHRS